VAAICGAALFSAQTPGNGAGLIGVAFAAGISILAMAYAVGHISGAHFNPAVTCGLWAAGRFEARDIPGYIIAQTLGGVCAAALFFYVAADRPDVSIGNFASNGYGSESPGQFALVSVMMIETVLTALFLIVVCGSTSSFATNEFAPLAIGLALTALHLIAIPVSNASFNPARSTATALFGGPLALHQLWVFWAAPLAGGLLGGALARVLANAKLR
jgi:aquaporin Z